LRACFARSDGFCWSGVRNAAETDAGHTGT
jgi:hypothetical protein